eukprot:scaffold287105_cov24-Tisochrysis_lutea.AAC.1
MPVASVPCGGNATTNSPHNGVVAPHKNLPILNTAAFAHQSSSVLSHKKDRRKVERPVHLLGFADVPYSMSRQGPNFTLTGKRGHQFCSETMGWPTTG